MMQSFVYEYATKVYFGEGAARKHLAQAISGFGQNVLLAYGGGSVKKNGIDFILGWAEAPSLTVVRSLRPRQRQTEISGRWR